MSWRRRWGSRNRAVWVRSGRWVVRRVLSSSAGHSMTMVSGAMKVRSAVGRVGRCDRLNGLIQLHHTQYVRLRIYSNSGA